MATAKRELAPRHGTSIQLQVSRRRMTMTMPLAFGRCLLAAMAVLVMVAAAMPAVAQQRNSDGSPNPTASVVDEKTLLREFPRITGRIDIPDQRAAVLIQPAGRLFQRFHEVILHWFGTIVLVGMLALLAIAYLIMGPIRTTAGRSGIRILRFTGFERFAHWLNATAFVILALTGLNITFGQYILMPVIGPDNFGVVSQLAKYVHNFTSFAFVIGMVLIVALWIRDNVPRRVDIQWLKEGGGFVKSKHPPAGRFNAGEKMVFWLALAAGIGVIVSGYLLMFPFYVTNIFGMQIAQGVHAIVALLFVALILGHIYIGTIGMEGAFEAMGQGTVDLNWAKEHHSLWLEQAARAGRKPQGQPAATPAE
jgi:formate dehydrogenase subunit gamma